ncbi:hypothetical protein J6253_09215 [bacterium]|jgi:hypothetical protein|nr:hypothetical protein [bacterium]MBP5592028.1 hypothetical protein [bacterium]
MENSLKKRVLGTKRGFYGLILSVVSVVALCWTLYARDDARAEFEALKAEGCFTDDNSWKQLDQEEQTRRNSKEFTRKCMAASNRLSQAEHAPSIFAVLGMIGFLLLGSSFANIKSGADKVMEEFEKENPEEKGEENDNKLS